MWLLVLFGATALLAYLAWSNRRSPPSPHSSSSASSTTTLESSSLSRGAEVVCSLPVFAKKSHLSNQQLEEFQRSWNPKGLALQGYLWKKSSHKLRGWQKRYFETDCRWLVYHSRDQLGGIIDLSLVRAIDTSLTSRKGHPKFSLAFSKESTMRLRAPSMEAGKLWIATLGSVIFDNSDNKLAGDRQLLGGEREEFCPLVEGGDLAGMRLNNFAGVPCLDFKRDVFARISSSQQAVYLDFSRLMDIAMRKLLEDKLVNPHKFYQAPDDFTKLRFLQSDKYDIPKALRRLTETVIWRQESGLDEFITKPDRALLARYRNLRIRRIIGADKVGRPLLVERLGEFMGNEEAYRGLSLKQFLACYAYDGCQIFACFRRQVEKGFPYGHSVGYLADITGIKFGTTMRMVPYFTALTEVVERHFVELGGPCLVINAPAIVVNVLWPVYRKSLDDSLANKVVVCGGTNDASSYLKNWFGSENCPVEFGGTKRVDIPHVPLRVDREFDAQFPREGLYPGLRTNEA